MSTTTEENTRLSAVEQIRLRRQEKAAKEAELDALLIRYGQYEDIQQLLSSGTKSVNLEKNTSDKIPLRILLVDKQGVSHTFLYDSAELYDAVLAHGLSVIGPFLEGEITRVDTELKAI
jgi:hypothetical protein